MYFVCQELNSTIYGSKKRCYYWGLLEVDLGQIINFSKFIGRREHRGI